MLPSKKTELTQFSHSPSLDKEINEAIMLSLDHSEESILAAIEKLEEISRRPSLSPDQKLNILSGLAQSFQRRGEHHKALRAIAEIEPKKQTRQDMEMEAYFKHLRAISLLELGDRRLPANFSLKL